MVGGEAAATVVVIIQMGVVIAAKAFFRPPAGRAEKALLEADFSNKEGI